jgi:outer membrane murein-binding lipoprotein Lpp
MKKIQSLLLGSVVIFSFVLSGCGPTAHVQKDNTVNFSNYQTYAWSAASDAKGNKGTNNSLTEQAVKDAAGKELSKQGWREVKKNPDVLLNYDVLVEKTTVQQSDPVYTRPFTRSFYNPYYRRFYSVYYPSQFLGYDDRNVPVKEGTITITMTDTDTDKTIWQGWTTNEVDNRHLTDKEVESSVKAIFRKFDVAKK